MKTLSIHRKKGTKKNKKPVNSLAKKLMWVTGGVCWVVATVLIIVFIAKKASNHSAGSSSSAAASSSSSTSSGVEGLSLDETSFAAYYINLAHRQDRKKFMENDFFPRLEVPTVTRNRIEAVKRSDGAMGCALSHIEALKTFENDPAKPSVALILEDDAEWLVRSPNEQLKVLLKDPSWSVCLLACNGKTKKRTEHSCSANGCLTTSAYLVRREYAGKLREHWEAAAKRKNFVPLDVTWHELMDKEPERWIVSNPKLVKQRASYSDIMKGDVNYGV